jgi:hypothetical protein
MAYEPPQKDVENLPEDAEPEKRYSSDWTRPDASASPGNVSSPKKADPGDYGTLPRSYLNVLTKARAETYAEEIPNAGWGKTLLGVAIVTLVSFGMKIFLAPFTLESFKSSKDYLANNGQDPNVDPWKTLFQYGEASTNPLLAFLVPLTFFGGAALLYVLARAVRDKEAGRDEGQGFMVHAYLLSLSYAPLHTIAALLNALSLFPGVSCVGSILALALGLYQLYSAGLSMQASQKLDAGKAQMVAFVPWVLGIILFIVVAVLLAVSFGSTVLQ